MNTRRHLLLLTAATALLQPLWAAAESWPSRPVTLVVPYPPGGPVDSLARVIAPKLGQELGQTIIIENKSGAGGSLGVDTVVRAQPDGYTFGFGVPGALTVLPHLQKVPYDPVKINYVSMVARVPQVIAVGPEVHAQTLKALIETAKRSPGTRNFGSAGNATTPHLGSELLKQEAGIDIVHVPYKGAAPAITALLSGEVQLLAADLSAIKPYLSQGIRVLAVSGPERLASMPDVPSTAELGLAKVNVASNYGLIAPANTPVDITDKLREALKKVLGDADVKAQIDKQGAIPMASTAAAYGELMQKESDRWGDLIKRSHIALN